MTIFIRNSAGIEVELTNDNTIICLFAKHDDLDHVAVTTEHAKCGLLLAYDRDFIERCVDAELPMLLRHDAADWAVERRMLMELSNDDLDRLLMDGES